MGYRENSYQVYLTAFGLFIGLVDNNNRHSLWFYYSHVNITIHRYLFSQVRSRFALVDKPEWEIATFLPLADFRNSSASKVYSDSRKKMNG